jgi:hypothetical protein
MIAPLGLALNQSGIVTWMGTEYLKQTFGDETIDVDKRDLIEEETKSVLPR